ncbi:hypothetical protein ACS3SW_08630 [Roseobacteraceae bacterium S113]
MGVRLICVVLACVWGVCAAAQEVTYRFSWEGGGGYAMSGAFSYDPAEIADGIVREGDLTCFAVAGAKDGAVLGSFELSEVTPETTWVFTFFPLIHSFATFDAHFPMPQAWNMDGFGFNCGPGGFGFNIGSAAQDLCFDGQLLVESQVPPDRPFRAMRDDGHAYGPGACRAPLLMGELVAQ